ncbi:hypothetical protein RvY_10537 [Ramazzottius varieornatus]|uniref:Uncharacterized protein n=1 Tax=Ramazzottius varieornatus TaxID=947166 RepID=A0A1D1VD23_RAMVA|nr:hypothetical protein RvY_10537 [Ramazzottius varieornatus]
MTEAVRLLLAAYLGLPVPKFGHGPLAGTKRKLEDLILLDQCYTHTQELVV